MLKLKGYICPCLIREEANVFKAMTNIGILRVKYSSSSSTDDLNNTSKNPFKNIVSGLFRPNNNRKNDKSCSNEEVEGSLSIMDSNQGPCLCIKFDNPSSSTFVKDDTTVSSNTHQKESVKIPLHTIGDIEEASTPSTIMIHARGNSAKQPTLNVMCSLDLVTQKSQEGHDYDILEQRNIIIDDLKTIVQWNDQQRLALGEEAQDTMEHDSNGATQTSLSQHALKLKHFANREIELKKLKRDREERKQRYLKDSGGLKYTAIAMASREIT
jgi:hypothetical protein